MPTQPIQNHTCGYYCTGQRHAVECVARPTHTAVDVRDGYERYVSAHGWRVVEVRPAPEADLTQWNAMMGWAYAPQEHTLRAYRAAPIEDEVVGWLVIIEPEEE